MGETIELSGTLTGNAGAIIIPAETGVSYTNQVGGYSCAQVEQEGYAVPIEVERRIMDLIFLSDLGPFRGHCYQGITDEWARALNEFLPHGVQIDPDRIGEAMEAWLPVVWLGKKGWLTWENSD